MSTLKWLLALLNWLLSLANKRPLLFSLAILLIIIIGLAYVVKYQANESQECEKYVKQLNYEHQLRLDSLGNYYRKRDITQAEELNVVLRSIIESYKTQIDEQKKINKSVSTEINKNLKN